MVARRAGSRSLSLFLLLVVSVALMVVDHRTDHARAFRSGATVLVTPLQAVAAVPTSFVNWVSVFFTSYSELRGNYEQLQTQHTIARARLQRLEALEAENDRLSQLLSASAKVAQKVLLAQLVEVSLEPFTHKVVVNRGESDGAYVGQAVIDPNGVVGQVTHATLFTSAVTLITDPGHAIPVQVVRNGLRAIVFGMGTPNQLGVPYLARHADIEAGDVLVTSGMGGRFPSGYPVARVTEIVRDPNEAFLQITAIPVARLDHAKEVLLIWQGSDAPDAVAGSGAILADGPEDQVGR